MKALPKAGSDVIELGMPFSDPMADGPAIQAAGLRALKGGQTLAKTLAHGARVPRGDNETPIVMMGYYNPIYIYGVDRFLADAIDAGIDGLIVVDLPPEMDEELCVPALKAGINFIRLATPTTDDKRLPKVLQNTSGFVYYVSMTGITGSALPDTSEVAAAVKRIKAHTDLPVCVGFGVKTAEQAKVIGASADGVVVGTAIVNAVANAPSTARRQPTRRRPWRRWSAGFRRACAPRALLRAEDFHLFRTIGADAMNWITNYVRPKINSMLGRRDMPENLWIKDPETGEMVFHKDLESNQFVIPSSGHHMKISARERLKFFFDDGKFEVLENPKVAVDPLKFRDEKRYTDRLREAKAKTGLEDAILTALGSSRRPSDRGHCSGFLFHGRFARHGGRRGDRPRL